MRTKHNNTKEPLSRLLLGALKKFADTSGSPHNYAFQLNRVRPFGLIALFTQSHYSRTIGRLKSKGLIQTRRLGPKIEIRITAQGLKFLDLIAGQNKIFPKTKWDKLWRMAIFDIPEEIKKKRDVFRNRLKALGFESVQKSVWVYPYPCRKELLALCKFYEIEPYVTLMEGKYLGDDTKLKQKFQLR